MLTDKANQAIAVIKSVALSGAPIIVAWSAGKDSCVVLNLVLTAARQVLSETGRHVPIFVTHADTGIENPELSAYAKSEIERINDFSRQNGLDVTVSVARPELNDRWAVRVIGGRCLPVFPSSAGGSRDCTVDFKIKPMNRLRKKLLKSLNCNGRQPVTMVGTRFEESTGRAKRMKERGETDRIPWEGSNGDLFLSPIARWDFQDVWDYISCCMDGEIKSYSDLADTFRIYSDATAAASAIEADIAFGGQNRSKACGTRFGCALCTATEDKSMRNMIRNDQKYEYLKELNQFQQFIINTQYDFNRRNWVGRTINKHGFIAIRPDVYSPQMLEELLRYALTIDVVEQQRAMELGIEPRFEIVGLKALIAIDAMWSLYGYHRPFRALKIYREVGVKGLRYPVPRVQRFAKRPVPPARYYYVGKNWDQDRPSKFNGLRDPIIEFACKPCIGKKVIKNGTTVLDIDTEQCFTVNEQGAYFTVKYDIDRLVHDADRIGYGYTHGYKHHVVSGYLAPAKGKEGIIDQILRRTVFKERQGLVGPDYDLQALLAKSVTRVEMEKTSASKIGTMPQNMAIPVQLDLPGFTRIEEKQAA